MSLARDVTTVGSATLLSRLLGFIRDMGVAAVLGAGALSDAFFAAMQVPNLFRRLLAEGALNAAFVPIWLRLRKDKEGARKFGREVLGTMLVLTVIVTLVAIFFAPTVIRLIAPGFAPEGARFALAVSFVEIVMPYLAVSALVAVAAAVLSAEGQVAAVSFGLIVFNVVLVAALGVVLLFGAEETQGAGTILAFSVIAGGLAQFIVMVRTLSLLPNPPYWPRFALSAETRRFFVRAIPGVVAAGAPQLMLIAGGIIASASPSAVSWLYYANRLYELPLGVTATMISAVMVPLIAASVRGGDAGAIASAQSRAFEIAIGLALPAAAALALIAEPIAGALFERGAFMTHDTKAVAAALAAIAFGLPGHVLEKIFGAISFAHEDTRMPMWTALAGLAVGTVGALTLFPRYGHVGIAAAIALSGWTSALLLWLALVVRGWLRSDAALPGRLGRILLATSIMGAALYGFMMLLAPWIAAAGILRLVALALLVAAGLAVYGLALQILGVVRLADLMTAARNRL
jgi:putative peptidoglycan lipid II flippase